MDRQVELSLLVDKLVHSQAGRGSRIEEGRESSWQMHLDRQHHSEWQARNIVWCHTD